MTFVVAETFSNRRANPVHRPTKRSNGREYHTPHVNPDGSFITCGHKRG
jgi:hypothetical protein